MRRTLPARMHRAGRRTARVSSSILGTIRPEPQGRGESRDTLVARDAAAAPVAGLLLADGRGRRRVRRLPGAVVVEPGVGWPPGPPAADAAAPPEKPAAPVVWNDDAQRAIDQAHAACFDNDPFPSAKKCAKCHEGHYREWSVSPHGYAQVSPVFNAMSNTLVKVTNGTNGDFCIRCHTHVGMALNEPIIQEQHGPAAESRARGSPASSVTASTSRGARSVRASTSSRATSSHRSTARRGTRTSRWCLANPDKYGAMKTGGEDPSFRGHEIHREAVPFFQLNTPGFCGSCHDVFAPNGFRLEDAFSEFKTGQAARCKHETCQDCHMGSVPGMASGFDVAPAARVGNAFSPPRQGPTTCSSVPITPSSTPASIRTTCAPSTRKRFDRGGAGHDAGMVAVRPAFAVGHRRVRGPRAEGRRVPAGLGGRQAPPRGARNPQ